ncbi:MAG: ABC transporter permease [Bacteroides sp.]|nr:ABC transporter permease [Bacteroides sp.]
MKLYLIIQSMLAQKGANAIKIISVAVGLFVSILVFCRLDYNYSYDNCFPDRDNLYQLWVSYEINGSTIGPFNRLPGKLGEGVMEAFGDKAGSATALGFISLPDLFDGDRLIDAYAVGADSLYFRTFGIEVLHGNPKADFTLPGTIYLCESLAKELYGDEDPIGKTLTYGHEKEMTIRGIYRDFPDNVTVERSRALISQSSFPLYNRRRIWNGADNWPVYFRLKPGHNLTQEEIDQLLNRMYQTHAPDTSEEKTVLKALPIKQTYLQNETVKRMNLILWILGVSLLLMTTLNYVLITIASLSRRAKSIGVQKCSGAGSGTIMGMFFAETLIVLLCSIAVMALLLYTTQPLIEETLSLSPGMLLAPERLWIPVSLLAFFLIVGGLLPGRIFARIPVTQVFRRFTERNSAWKRSLLFIQIAGVAFISSILIVITVQYNDVVNRDMGFSVKNLAMFQIPSKIDRDAFRATIANLPYVEDVSSSYYDPLELYSGDMITDAKGTTLFNTRFDGIDKGYIDLMGITLIEGREPLNNDEMVISEEFARSLGIANHPLNSIVYFEESQFKVVGVVKDYVIGGFTNDYLPITLLSSGGFRGTATVRLKEPFDDSLRQLDNFLKETYPTNRFEIVDMMEKAINLYSDVRTFRDSVLIATITLIFISLMGLIGFARDEVQRRSKEIAIRKVNGADVIDILNLLIADILRLAIPATVIGSLCAAYINHRWLLPNFTVTPPHIWVYYILADLAVLILVVACVLSIILRTANENPVNRLKIDL